MLAHQSHPLPLGEVGVRTYCYDDHFSTSFLQRIARTKERRFLILISLRYALTLALSQREWEPSKSKPEPHSLRDDGSGLQAFGCSSLSADKHLIVSVAAVNWTRRGRYEHFQSASHAGQSRGQFACRFNQFSLYEL